MRGVSLRGCDFGWEDNAGLICIHGLIDQRRWRLHLLIQPEWWFGKWFLKHYTGASSFGLGPLFLLCWYHKQRGLKLNDRDVRGQWTVAFDAVRGWTVQFVDEDEDLHAATFSGPNAEADAREYATWKNQRDADLRVVDDLEDDVDRMFRSNLGDASKLEGLNRRRALAMVAGNIAEDRYGAGSQGAAVATILAIQHGAQVAADFVKDLQHHER